jgi:hypothetical protein
LQYWTEEQREQQKRKVVVPFSHLLESPSIARFIPIEEVVAVKVTAQGIAQYGCFFVAQQ